MSRTKDWNAVTDFDDFLVRKDGNRRITKTNAASAIADDLQTLGFLKSTTILTKFSTVSTAVNLTLTSANNLVFVDCSGNDVTITLPPLSTLWNATTSQTQVLIIKRIDNSASFKCVLDPDGVETIDGNATLELTGITYPFAAIITNGSALFQIF
jgi:hypothetical protein